MAKPTDKEVLKEARRLAQEAGTLSPLRTFRRQFAEYQRAKGVGADRHPAVCKPKGTTFQHRPE